MDLSQLTLSETPARGTYDAVIVGSGPNGLAAAITIAQRGYRVLVMEAGSSVGGGMRSAELTLPGFVHDVCSSVHAMAAVSPFFQSVPLAEHGLQWVEPEFPVAHPLGGEAAAIGERSVEATAARLGRDGEAYRKLMGPLVERAGDLFSQLLGPIRFPRHPWLVARLGLSAVRSAAGLASSRFEGEAARALFAGHASHMILPLEQHLSAAVGMMLALSSHAGGWPVARGGSQQVADAMGRYLQSLGGEIVVRRAVESLDQLPEAKVVLYDVAPPRMEAIVGDRFPKRFRRTLRRYRFGPGVFKVDWALSEPIPWAAPECRRAGTVHVGGDLQQIAASERSPWSGNVAERPFVLVTQPSLFDASRAPAGKHTAWGYCHVPHGSAVDVTDKIESQLERYAPGFRDCVLQRHAMSAADFESYNANYVGGDITGGVMDLRQLFTRPSVRPIPYRTPARDLFICSASTPPGGGVHGMCGWHAAHAALRELNRR